MIGTALGGALTSKYVAILLPVSLAAWCVATGRSRAPPALLGASAVAILLFAPVVWWNAHHDWASFRYQFASRHREASFQADRFASYLGSQALYLSPLLFGLVAAAGLRVGLWAALRREPGASFLWWMGAPTLAAFAFAGAVTSFKPNWLAPGYLTMLPLALRRVDRWMQRAPRAARRLERSASAVALASVVLVTAHALRPFVPLPHGADPTQDMRGWPVAAAWADRAASDLCAHEPALAPSPFFAAGRYQNAARLEFYLPGNPPVVCLNPGRDAYDDWQDLTALRGRDFVFMGTSRFSTPPERLASVRAHRTFHIVRAAAGPGTTHILTIDEAYGFEDVRPGTPGSARSHDYP